MTALLVAPLLFPFRATAGALPEAFAPPPGFAVDERNSKTFDFNHEPIAYPGKGGSFEHIEPEGRTWWIHLTITPPNKTSDATDAAMRRALPAQGWEIRTPSGTLIAHRVTGGKQQWFKGSAGAGDYSARIIEVSTPPHSLALEPPAASPESFGAGDDFPYLLHFPGSKLEGTKVQPSRSFDASPRGGAKEQLVGPPLVEKHYQLPASVSPYEFMVVYRDALAKAGWSLIRTFASGDALVVAHYAKNGRDLYCYLHGGEFSVADVGAASEAKRLAEALATQGHVALYGIYFDVDQSTLKPESETALAHILDLLQRDPELLLELQGHTDSSGAADHNRTLSDARASSVKRWLVAHGVGESRLVSKGYGDTQPVGDNRTPEGRARNRRVELKKS